MSRVARHDYEPTMPCPEERAWFELPLEFTPAEDARIRYGFLPMSSDDRWFLFVEEDVLYCHRSWTGACIFGARLEACENGSRLTRCWVSRDTEHYTSDGLDADRQLLHDLILDLFLSPGL